MLKFIILHLIRAFTLFYIAEDLFLLFSVTYELSSNIGNITKKKEF